MRITFITFLALLMLPVSASAAVSINLNSSALLPHIGESFSVTLSVTSHESINAIEGAIVLPEGIDLVSLRSGSSIVPLWIETPHIDGRDISFAGIIPGGWASSGSAEGRILTAILVARTPGNYSITMATSTQVLLNDGNGSEAQTAMTPLFLQAYDDGKPPRANTLESDHTPPDPFTPIVSRSDALFDGDYFIAFNATDRGSGLSSYQIAERKGWGSTASLTWRTVTSPARLLDQSRQSTIYIKAIDQAGNERIETVGPERHVNLIEIVLFLLMLVAAAFAIRNEFFRRV